MSAPAIAHRSDHGTAQRPFARADLRPGPTDRPGPTHRSRWRAIGRTPLTAVVVLTLLSLGIATGTLWRAAPAGGWVEQLAFGPATLAQGRWWTFITGTFVLPRPEFYAVVGTIVVVGLGAYERRVGWARAGTVLIGTQLAATMLPAVLVLLSPDGLWPWADAMAGNVDLGLSAGGLGVVGAASALCQPARRARIRAGGVVYLAIMVAWSGLLWDVEHLLAFILGVLTGPLVAGRRRSRSTAARFDGLYVRQTASLVLVCTAAATVVQLLYPGVGGILGDGRTVNGVTRGGWVAVVGGVVLMVVADALRRGRATAWWVAVTGTVLSIGTCVVQHRGPLRIGEIVLCTVFLAALVIFRDAWQWRTPDHLARRSLRRLTLAAATFTLLWTGVLLVFGDRFRPGAGFLDGLREVLARLTFSPASTPAHGLGRVVPGLLSVGWAVTLVVLVVGWLYADRGPGVGPRAAVGRLLRRHGGGSLGWMRMWPSFSTWTTRDGLSAISYRVVGTVAIALGDPVGPEDHSTAAVDEFDQFCRWAGWTPCWFAATPALSRRASGWRAVQIGEDTRLDLSGVDFVGKAWQDIRTARNRAAREHISMRAGRLADFAPALQQQISQLSQAWMGDKALPEMGFTLGTMDDALDPEMRTHVAVDTTGRVHGVTTWLPVHRGGAVVGWTLDVMRRYPDGFRPVMEYLIAESLLLFKSEQYETVSLSVAPLARRWESERDGSVLDRTLDLTSRMLEPAYGFRSLLAFKAKFQPEFTPVHLMYRRTADLPAIALAISRAYLPHLDLRSACGLVRAIAGGTRG